jgi:hypothetical protein
MVKVVVPHNSDETPTKLCHSECVESVLVGCVARSKDVTCNIPVSSGSGSSVVTKPPTWKKRARQHPLVSSTVVHASIGLLGKK